MNINVPNAARGHFWEEPPVGSWEFWSFRFPPPCRVGDTLHFRFDGVEIARAVCAKIEEPGQSKCQGTGRFERGWKVFWTPETFVDLRTHTTADAEPESPIVMGISPITRAVVVFHPSSGVRHTVNVTARPAVLADDAKAMACREMGWNLTDVMIAPEQRKDLKP